MELVHVIDTSREVLLEAYFVDKVTGKRVNYSVEELKKSIRQQGGLK